MIVRGTVVCRARALRFGPPVLRWMIEGQSRAMHLRAGLRCPLVTVAIGTNHHYPTRACSRKYPLVVIRVVQHCGVAQHPVAGL